MNRPKQAPSEEEVIELTHCPDCDAARRSRCVYMPVAFPSSANADKVGQPTKRVHHGRRFVANGILRRRWDQERLHPPERALSAQVQIARAEAEFARRERAELVQWLSHYVSVLIDA